MTYRNHEGYPDPSAGEALANIERDDRRERRRLEKLRTRKDYDHLCQQFRRLAAEYGFVFLGQIWLRHKKSGFIFKGGEQRR